MLVIKTSLIKQGNKQDDAVQNGKSIRSQVSFS
jgi:hypothetical protein